MEEPPPAPAPALGIETRQQKAELEASLFGDPGPPIVIAHYAIIGTIGAGGMGVVYLARDERLDRRVALKLLRKTNVSDLAQARLEREAQSMARLAHPNVVTIHEVGEFEGKVFLAMEFVGGSNLRGWLQAEPRSWRTIVDIFLQAGEGLAAAHDAGLIHRDFKPDNVLVGDDRRVRVADFGLAHHAPPHSVNEAELTAELGLDTRTPPPATASRSGASFSGEYISRLDTPLTETGTIMGTPAYMAPEQHLRGPTDTRSDQFSFCVALWEALYGQRPFAGSTLPQLVSAVLGGTIDAPIDAGEVPAWLRAVVQRGLATNPAQRWPSMRALLNALARDPDVIRRRRWRIGSVVAVTLSLIVGLSHQASSEARQNARQRYWNTLTAELLDVERERGLRQATDDARRAKNATRMSNYRRYRPREGILDHEDSTVAAALLREVEGEERATEAWVSAANEILGQTLSYAIFSDHRDVIVDLAFAPDSSAVYSASHDDEVWRWDVATGAGQAIIHHERDVVAIAVSPKGDRIASASADRRVQLWSSSTARAQVLVEHLDELTAIAFDPSGQLVASASKDGLIKLTHVDADRVQALVGHTGPVYALDFDASGARLATASGDGSVRLWRVAPTSGAKAVELARFDEHTDAVYHVRFLEDGRIVSGSDDGTVRLWDPDQSPPVSRILASHGLPITAVDVEGSRVASAAQYAPVRITDVDGQREAVELPTTSPVWSVRFVDAGRQLALGAFDGRALLYDSLGHGPPQIFLGHRQAVLRVAVDPSGRWLATSSYDTELRLWELGREPLRTTMGTHEGPISAIEVHDEQARAAAASHDGSVDLWDLETRDSIARLDIEGESIRTLAMNPSGSRLAAGTYTGKIVLWRPQDGSTRELSGHEDQIWQLRFDDSGQTLASISTNGSLRLWDPSSERELLLIDERERKASALDFEPGGARFVLGSSDGSLRIFDTATGDLAVSLPGHTGTILALTRGPDGQTLATASDDGTARLWPDEDPDHALVLRGHRQPVWSVAFDASGARVVTASHDCDARIWDAVTGAHLQTLAGHSEALWDARFLSDGRVVTASEDNTIRVWSMDDSPALVLSAHGGAVTELALTQDGRWLLSGSPDRAVELWGLERLETDSEVLQARLEAASIWCLDVDRRVRELGESPREADLARAECEAKHGR